MSPFEQRSFSSSQVRKAGELLRAIDTCSEEDKNWALEVLDNFRALHAVPLNTFQATLRKRLDRLGIRHFIVAQRIKRKPTILDKLQRFDGMQLNRMGDIGGIRAIVSSVSQLQQLVEAYTEPSERKKLKHEFVRHDDYVNHPKKSGYRGVHLEYRYKSSSKNREAYNGLRIEMQFRTELQHAWATAVETFEAFMGEKFKSSQGSREWLDYFALVSSAFAHLEGTPPLHEHKEMAMQQLSAEIKKRTDELQVLHMMEGFVLVDRVRSSQNMKNGYALLVFDAVERSGSMRLYHENRYKEAYMNYLREETRSVIDAGRQVVLVKMDTVKNLAKAYPNYFADLSRFKSYLAKVMGA